MITNLFRDQLDRYGEIDSTMKLLEQAMDMAPDMKIIVNGDDSLSAYLALESGHPYVTYGISQKVLDEQDSHEIREGRFCKRCGARLEYDFYHYSQIGVYHCPPAALPDRKLILTLPGSGMEQGLEFDVEGRPYSG